PCPKQQRSLFRMPNRDDLEVPGKRLALLVIHYDIGKPRCRCAHQCKHAKRRITAGGHQLLILAAIARYSSRDLTRRDNQSQYESTVTSDHFSSPLGVKFPSS